MSDTEVLELLSLLRTDERLADDAAALDSTHEALCSLTHSHVEMYAMLCICGRYDDAHRIALRLAWLQGAGAALAILRARGLTTRA